MIYPEPKPDYSIISKEKSYLPETHRVQLVKTRPVPDTKIQSPEDIFSFLKDMEDFDRERFIVVYLNTKNKILGVENISTGTLSSTIVHPREVVKGAILSNSAGVILAHNHPSGDPTPSSEDNTMMVKLHTAFKCVGIDIIDAVIIGRNEFYSYKEHGTFERLLSAGVIMENNEHENDRCSTAIRAAMSVIGDECGQENKEMTIGGIKFKINIPDSVGVVMEQTSSLTIDQRIKAIEESTWAHNEATGLCTKLFGTQPGTQEFNQCVAKVARRLAEGMVGRNQ